jgi:hypothetical protein
MRNIWLIAFIVMVLMTFNPAFGAPIDLTGVWDCDDGGTYYITQFENTVVWYAERSPTNPIWSTVAYGGIYPTTKTPASLGTIIKLDWTEVPKGIFNGKYGAIALSAKSNDTLKKMQDSGPSFYGGSSWERRKPNAMALTYTVTPISAPKNPNSPIPEHVSDLPADVKWFIKGCYRGDECAYNEWKKVDKLNNIYNSRAECSPGTKSKNNPVPEHVSELPKDMQTVIHDWYFPSHSMTAACGYCCCSGDPNTVSKVCSPVGAKYGGAVSCFNGNIVYTD